MENDLISRRAAISEILGQPPEPHYPLWYAEQIKRMPATQPERNELKKSYAAGFHDGYMQAQPRWIPVTERLPEEKDAGILKKLGTEKRSEYVLATVEVNGERMTVTACTYDGKWDWNMQYAFPDFKVIAWQPLPAPYREGEE